MILLGFEPRHQLTPQEKALSAMLGSYPALCKDQSVLVGFEPKHQRSQTCPETKISPQEESKSKVCLNVSRISQLVKKGLKLPSGELTPDEQI